jgi:hypothetical protein
VAPGVGFMFHICAAPRCVGRSQPGLLPWAGLVRLDASSCGKAGCTQHDCILCTRFCLSSFSTIAIGMIYK